MLLRAGQYVTNVGGIVMNKWTVWVGGSEVNLCYLSETQAHNMVVLHTSCQMMDSILVMVKTSLVLVQKK